MVVQPIRVSEPSPVYSALAVVEDAVEPLSQSLSVARLFTLPVNDSTESQLEDGGRNKTSLSHVHQINKENKTNKV